MEQQDAVAQNKSIYQASSGEVFRKNFVAGFARALGGLFVNILLWVFIYVLFINFALPLLTPYLKIMANLSNSIQTLTDLQKQQNNLIPNNLNLKELFK